MSYRKNGRNKAYENLKANPDVKKHMLEACIIADKEDSLGENVDELGIRRNEKMKKKEYGDAFKKIAIASLSLIATGGIIAGVVSYSKNGGNKERLVTKETTSEYKSTEKETDEILENIECKIKLNKKDQKEFKYVYPYFKGNEDLKLDNTTISEVVDEYYKKLNNKADDYFSSFISNTGKCICYQKFNESDFRRYSKNYFNNTYEFSYGLNIFATDGKVVLHFNDDKKLSKYDIETGEETEIVIPESLKDCDNDNNDGFYLYSIYNGILYIVEYIDNIQKNTYVYDINTGEYDLLVKAKVSWVINDYVLIKDYTDQNDLHEIDYIKKITDNGLEDVMQIEEGVVCNGKIDEDYFSLVKKVKNNESYTGEDEETDWKEEHYGKFNTKTGKLVLENYEGYTVDVEFKELSSQEENDDNDLVKGDYMHMVLGKDGEIRDQFDIEVLEVNTFTREWSNGFVEDFGRVTCKTTKEQKEIIEKYGVFEMSKNVRD